MSHRQSRNLHRRAHGHFLSVFLLAFGALIVPGCTHNSAARLAHQTITQPPRPKDAVAATQYVNAQLPILQRNHQILAVGSYRLPEPVVLPSAVTPQPTATAYFSKVGSQRTLIGVSIFFPESDAKAVLAWAQAFPIVVEHSGVALWQTKHSHYLVQNKPAGAGYAWSDQPTSDFQAVWSIYGTFFTKGWNYGITFDHGAAFIGQTIYPLPITKNSLSLNFTGFHKRPHRIWLPIYERGHRIVSIGTYQLPDSVVLPANLTPMPLALATFARRSGPTLPSIRIFFPPKEERAVFQWGKSYPAVAANVLGVQWQPSRPWIWMKNSSNPNGVSSSETIPSAVPVAWLFQRSLPAKGGEYSLTVSGAPVVSAADLGEDASARYLFSVGAADYVGGSDNFGSNSPLKGEQRHVALQLNFLKAQP